jgi:hypothetical protein
VHCGRSLPILPFTQAVQTAEDDRQVLPHTSSIFFSQPESEWAATVANNRTTSPQTGRDRRRWHARVAIPQNPLLVTKRNGNRRDFFHTLAIVAVFSNPPPTSTALGERGTTSTPHCPSFWVKCLEVNCHLPQDSHTSNTFTSA